MRGGGRGVGGDKGNGQGSSNMTYSSKRKTDLEQIHEGRGRGGRGGRGGGRG